MIYITVDGMFSGTGIRDSIEGGYLKPDQLGLTGHLVNKITNWLNSYEEAHYMQYEDEFQVECLDNEGMEICKMIKAEIPDSRIEYFSSAKMKKLSYM